MAARADVSQELARSLSVWVQVQSMPVNSGLEERNWEVVGSLGCWRRRLARKVAGGQEVVVWLGNRRGRIGVMTGEGSARRKLAEWRAGWED